MIRKIAPGILLCLSLIIAQSTVAQQLDHVQGEILVKLWPEAALGIQSWTLSKRDLNGVDAKVEYKRLVSVPMDIHTISFDHNAINENEFLRAIQDDPMVQAAQFDHIVELRSTVPNDPQFGDQWQYINNMPPDADIDMDLAWDIATGGLTPDGDTIVACVIDDGINLNHPDMQANLWINHAEIPNNGLDDDNNGFVDDYRGWHTGSNTDNVGGGGGHGTPVAGIVGAVGNNGVGVSGVNWNVKLMIVRGGTGLESEVLEAYSYPLIARQRYHATNGTEGAFVVSTNASWGINQGQPANAPLWCAVYDTLGVHGILNCGATANANFDIDVVGDLPTACPSEYLISVTNMNRQDVKVTGAGYGLETIDLGAFGQNTWTTSLNSYGGFGGTSGATPHVTGTIALMYSAPCGTLTSIAKSNPGAAAAMVRDFILNGVDPNASLDGITTTGGRLNVANAMMDLMTNCGPCPPPASLEVQNVLDVSADLNWISNDSTLTSDVNWRELGALDWNMAEDVGNPFTLTGLIACTEYEVQVMANCASENSTSATFIFKTDGCCVNPTDLTVSDIEENEATFTWSSILAAQGYNLIIQEVGTGNLDAANATGLTYTFNGLNSCTEYEVKIQVDCGGDIIDFSEGILFRTKGCGACKDFVYCDHKDLNSEEEWIESIQVGEFVNQTGNDGGYGNFEDISDVTFYTGETYDLVLEPGHLDFNTLEGWRIWIDFNGDGDFDDEAEMAFNLATLSNSTIDDKSLTIPESATSGTTRMRIAMASLQLPARCDGVASKGEVEDYCVSIMQGPPSSTKHQFTSLQNLNIFPNPVIDDLTIEFDFNTPQDILHVELINQLGQKVMQKLLKNVALGKRQLQMDLGELSDGIYFVSLKNGEGESVVKKVLRVGE